MTRGSSILNDIGVVVIGRNEGDRLIRCLDSIQKYTTKIVYVDSGSDDDSVFRSRAKGIEIVELDLTVPFTAARARNEGFKRLYNLVPRLNYVQFVDGDCEVAIEWFTNAIDYLDTHDRVAVVCGRRRERFPEHSIYNKLCDIEWDTPIGSTDSCGGDFLSRCTAFKEVGGFNSDLIAGEEPDLCLRMRGGGWGIQRIGFEMTIHDANISSFKQWWLRCVRAGYACAEGFVLHQNSRQGYCKKEVISITLWAFIIPICIFCLIFLNPYFTSLLLVYPLKVFQISKRVKNKIHNNILYSLFVMIGKFAEFVGQTMFVYNKIKNKKSGIIEYK